MGEIGEGIPEGFGGVSGSGSLWKDGPKVRRFWVVFSGRKVLSLSGNSLESSVPLPGRSHLVFSSLSPLFFTLISLLPPLDLTTPFLAFAGLPH